MMPERQITRLDIAARVVDRLLQTEADPSARRDAFVHLYGVGHFAALLALRRGMSRAEAELAEIAGLLHDIATYVPPTAPAPDHARESAARAAGLLADTGAFSPEEIARVTQAIARHSDKHRADLPLDEVLKDADVLQHWLRNPLEDWGFRQERAQRLVGELGLTGAAGEDVGAAAEPTDA